MKRIRYREAMGDLLKAKLLDVAQGRQFLDEIEVDLAKAQHVSFGYENGIRESLIGDFEAGTDVDQIAKKILLVSFDCPRAEWGWVTHSEPLFEWHFFNELDNVRLFEDVDEYPEAKELLRLYPLDFIEFKLDQYIDQAAYRNAETKLHMFLCCYDEPQMCQVRRTMLYRLHASLLDRDYDGYTGLGSDCPGVTREAYEYLIEHHGHERGYPVH